MKDIRVFAPLYGDLSKKEKEALIITYKNNRNDYYSGVEICDKLWNSLPNDTEKYKKYNRLTKQLRIAFPHIIIGEGRATRHYYPKSLSDKWLDNVFKSINKGE